MKTSWSKRGIMISGRGKNLRLRGRGGDYIRGGTTAMQIDKIDLVPRRNLKQRGQKVGYPARRWRKRRRSLRKKRDWGGSRKGWEEMI